MATSFGALCTDFYINQKVGLKMDLPADRETILHLFDRTDTLLYAAAQWGGDECATHAAIARHDLQSRDLGFKPGRW